MPLPDNERSRSLWGDGILRADLRRVRDGLKPVLDAIADAALAAELDRAPPFQAIAELKRAGFTALRIPAKSGGAEITLAELFEFVMDLAAADSNVAQALRAHFGFVEHILSTPEGEYRRRWLERLGRGDIAGAAAAEPPGAARDRFETTLSQRDGTWVINGTKHYTTGSLYADWLTVTATAPDGRTAKCAAARNDPGLEILDDWDGMGQRLTASGTAHFRDVRIQDGEHHFGNTEFPHSQGFFQLYHLATAAGIAQAAARSVADAVSARRRGFSHAAGALPASDPQILELVGRVVAAAHAATAIVRQAARALDAAQRSREDADGPSIKRAELEIYQAQEIVFPLTLEAVTLLFDALGGTATLRRAGFDRFWRNIRTIACHNPRVYRTRIVGDYAVNGTLPPAQWRVGTSG